MSRWFGKGGKTVRAPASPPVPVALPLPGRTRPVAGRELTLARATADYARAFDKGFFARLPDRDLVRLYAAMGAEIWSWQHARRLVGQPPWRAAPGLPEDGERQRAARQMREDIPMWERALEVQRAAVEIARDYGRRAPDPLRLPPDVAAIIDARLIAAARRAARRQSRSGGDAPASAPEGTEVSNPGPR